MTKAVNLAFCSILPTPTSKQTLKNPTQIRVKEIITKTKGTMELTRKFQNVLPRPALVTIYEAIVKPYLEHGDIAYDKA